MLYAFFHSNFFSLAVIYIVSIFYALRSFVICPFYSLQYSAADNKYLLTEVYTCPLVQYVGGIYLYIYAYSRVCGLVIYSR